MQVLLADQLGPHFQLEAEVLLPEVLSQFSKRVYHRKKAHIILSALRHRALDQGVSRVELQSYRDLPEGNHSIVYPTSREFLSLAKAKNFQLHQSRGFASSFADWDSYVQSKGSSRLVLEDFYRHQRRRIGLLMDGKDPIGNQWNFDADNRLPLPKEGLATPGPFIPLESDIDAWVREDLDKLQRDGKAHFSGTDGERVFAVTRSEALAALKVFIDTRLDLFGPYEDAIDEANWTMSHSMLSVPMNLGLLDPIEVVSAAEEAYKSGKARLSSVEGFIRQIIGWRDYVWHLYWQFGPEYTEKNELKAKRALPVAWSELDGTKTSARCLSQTLDVVREQAWHHHIPRLMILGNIAMQQGYNPKAVNDWFIDNFADGYKWVMPANTIGMSLHADGGLMSTKPYAGGGSYISKMSNHCKACPFDPKARTGDTACPVTNGYWQFLDRNQERFSKNHRMFQAMSGLKRLADREALSGIDFDKYGF